MAQYAHKGQILPLTNQMIPIDKQTTFHASYDYHLNGISKEGMTFPMGATTVTSFAGNTSSKVSTGKFTDMGLALGANNFTVEFWYRKRSGYLRILGGSSFTLTDNGNGQFKLTKYGIIDIYGGTIPTDTNWHHIALSHSSTTGVTLYLDGVLHVNNTNTANLNAGYPNFPDIGWGEYGAFDGEVNEFRVWNKVLRRNEITDNMYRVLNGDENGLIKYLKLNEKEGAIAFDSSNLHVDAVRSNITSVVGPTVANLLKGQGKFGGAVSIEPDTTNLMAGRDITVDTSYGVVGGSDGIGSYFIPQARTQGWAGIRIPGTSVAAGKTYTWSLEILCDTTFALAWDANVTGGGYTGNDAGRTALTYGATTYDTPGQWKKIWLTATIASDMTSPVASDSFCPGDAKIMDGRKIYYRNPQIEQRDYPTSYVASSRPVGKLWYPKELINPKAFTISCWFNIPWMHRSSDMGAGIMGNYWHPIIELCPMSSQGITGFAIEAGIHTQRTVNLKSAGTWHGDKYGTTAINDNQWYHLVATFDGANYKIYINGNLEINYADTALSTIYNDTVLMVGGGYHGKAFCLIDEIRIESRAISSDETTAWAASGLHYNYLDYSQYID